NGIECDNDGSGTAATPVTRPQLSNFTFVGPNDASGTASNHNYANRWRRRAQFVLRNSILMGYQKGGFGLESDGTGQAYVDGISEFRNNLVHAVTKPYFVVVSNGNPTVHPGILTDADIRSRAETDGCITFSNPSDIMLTNP